MIRGFKCRETERIFRREGSKRFRSIEKLALRKLLLLEGSERLEDLRIPPGNRLEKLGGDRAGQHSIRVNDHGEFVFVGAIIVRGMWKWWTIIKTGSE